MYGVIIGAIAGGVGAGVSSLFNSNKYAKKYKQYANQIREAAEKYSGHNADVAMTNQGQMQARQLNSLNNNQQALSSNLSTVNAQNAANNVNMNDNYQTGQNLGRNLAASNLNNKYNKATADAQMGLKQAKLDYDLGMGTTQGIMQGVSTAANTYNTIKSDERIKEPLPQADVEDALRQINSVEYKYKDGLGLDQDKHVGVTAQSLEGTAFDDVVIDNGIKELDKNKLLGHWSDIFNTLTNKIEKAESLHEKVVHLRSQE